MALGGFVVGELASLKMSFWVVEAEDKVQQRMPRSVWMNTCSRPRLREVPGLHAQDRCSHEFRHTCVYCIRELAGVSEWLRLEWTSELSEASDSASVAMTLCLLEQGAQQRRQQQEPWGSHPWRGALLVQERCQVF